MIDLQNFATIHPRIHPITQPAARSVAKLTMLEHPPLSALSRCMFHVSHLQSSILSLLRHFSLPTYYISVMLSIFVTRYVKLNNYSSTREMHDEGQKCPDIFVRRTFPYRSASFFVCGRKSAFSREMLFATVFRPADGQSM